MSGGTLQLEKTEVFLRNKFVSFSQANLSVASSSVLYGLSVYTVFGATRDATNNCLQIFRLQDHYQRLINSAKVMDLSDFEQKWNFERFADTAQSLLKRNNISEDVLIRATVFVDELAAGTRMHGLANALSMYVYPFGEIMAQSGVHICISGWQRNSDKAIPSNLKANGSYVNASLMKNAALMDGYDDAIALNDRGQVSEGTVANIFIVKDGELITPDSSSDILIGITRDSILQLAKHAKIPCIERPMKKDELFAANEAFFCGSSANITPILSIDKRSVGDGTTGPLTRKFIEAYSSARHGNTSDSSHWLTEVKV